MEQLNKTSFKTNQAQEHRNSFGTTVTGTHDESRDMIAHSESGW